MPSLLFILALGFFLGVKHSFEADHIIAVSTIASDQKNPFKAALVGTFWGIGHTTTLLIIGILVLLLKISIPQKVSISLEGLVGIMLIILGVRALIKAKSFHIHKHEHRKKVHEHFHLEDQQVKHSHHMPFLVGFVHGVAGSGALMLLVLSTIPSIMVGLYYILVFGLGSIIGMSMMSFIIGVPFLYSKNRLPKLENYLRIGAGILSIFFGIYVIFEVSLGLF